MTQTAVPLGLVVVAWGVLTSCTEPNPGYQPADDGAAPVDQAPAALDQRLVPHQAEGDGGDGGDGASAAACADAACVDPPGSCYAAQGLCDPATDACSYAPLAAGTACTSVDLCLQPGSCDGQGSCVTSTLGCDLPHASGGSCVGGSCQGYLCESGWGDCNASWSDGCETDLSSDVGHCGGCGKVCSAGANATASCREGQCEVSCSAPYQDCNQDPKDGCEIPVGQPNSCDRSGLSVFSSAAGATPGCGTPYCGKGSNSSKNKSFGSWHCAFCAHCQLFDDGGAWCLTEKGTFSADRCTGCCNPASSAFPQLCKP